MNIIFIANNYCTKSHMVYSYDSFVSFCNFLVPISVGKKYNKGEIESKLYFYFKVNYFFKLHWFALSGLSSNKNALFDVTPPSLVRTVHPLVGKTVCHSSWTIQEFKIRNKSSAWGVAREYCGFVLFGLELLSFCFIFIILVQIPQWSMN